MEVIWQYLSSSPILVIALLIVVALVLSKLSDPPKDKVSPEDLVPHYKRFDRREPELGDRRHREGAAPAHPDRRSIGRRASDWVRRRR